MAFLIHQEIWGNVGPLSEDCVIKSGGWLSRWIVSWKPVRPLTVINAFTFSLPDSLHRAVYMQLLNFLILPKIQFHRSCNEEFIHNQDRFQQFHLGSAWQCSGSCVCLWDSPGFSVWVPWTIFCGHICESQKLQEFMGWGANVWSIGDETHMGNSSLYILQGGLSRVFMGFWRTIEWDPLHGVPAL